VPLLARMVFKLASTCRSLIRSRFLASAVASRLAFSFCSCAWYIPASVNPEDSGTDCLLALALSVTEPGSALTAVVLGWLDSVLVEVSVS
jgi:hypothetical protein